MISTTGTTIGAYLDWAKREIEKKEYGEVTLKFVICNKQVVDVSKGSIDNDHFQLRKKE
jgi:hypothetical protein